MKESRGIGEMAHLRENRDMIYMIVVSLRPDESVTEAGFPNSGNPLLPLSSRDANN